MWTREYQGEGEHLRTAGAATGRNRRLTFVSGALSGRRTRLRATPRPVRLSPRLIELDDPLARAFDRIHGGVGIVAFRATIP